MLFIPKYLKFESQCPSYRGGQRAGGAQGRDPGLQDLPSGITPQDLTSLYFNLILIF